MNMVPEMLAKIKERYPDLNIGRTKMSLKCLLKTIDKRINNMKIHRLDALRLIKLVLEDEIDEAIVNNFYLQLLEKQLEEVTE